MTDEAKVERFVWPQKSRLEVSRRGRDVTWPVAIDLNRMGAIPRRILKISDRYVARDVTHLDCCVIGH